MNKIHPTTLTTGGTNVPNSEKEEREAAAAAAAAVTEENDIQDHPVAPLPPISQLPQSTRSTGRRIVQRRRRISDQPSTSTIILDTDYIEKVLQGSNLPVQVYSFEMERTIQRCCTMILSCTQHTTSQSHLPLNFHVALQMPEGLLLYATVLVDVLQKLISHHYYRHYHLLQNKDSNIQDTSNAIRPLDVQMSILSDVTYGACCIDDITAALMKCHILIHYGHSCLVPIQHTVIPVHYVFVEIQFYIPHCVDTIDQTLFPPLLKTTPTQVQQQPQLQPQTEQQQHEEVHIHLYLLGTIQFRHALSEIREQLLLKYNHHCQNDLHSATTTTTLTISIPQCKPLSPGEVLGCTSPILNRHDNKNDDTKNGKTVIVNPVNTTTSSTTPINIKTKAMVCFIADGRFHLESTMIANHSVIDTFYRYDPYSRILSIEQYEFDEMKQLRFNAIQYASQNATMFGIILGTLGRQGNPAIVQRIQTIIRKHPKQYKSFVVLLSEITPQKLHLLSQTYCNSTSKDTLCWVQVACPRLSVDWGHTMSLNEHKTNTTTKYRPMVVLNPYELYVALEETDWCCNDANNNNHSYPMDYYSNNGGPWTNYYDTNKKRQI